MTKPTHNITYGADKINFSLLYSNRKTLGIKVLPDASVVVTAPAGSSETVVYKKIKSKAPWILRQQLNFQHYHPFTPPRKYVNGETHLYLGRQYKLKIFESCENSIVLFRGHIIINTKKTHSDHIEKSLKEWYRNKAAKIFLDVLNSSFSKFSNYKIPFPVIQIRFMPKRWGSCTPSGKIILNPELIKAPKASIEYVITHELCHLVHPNHTKSFINLQQKMMPDWKKWKQRLEYHLA